MKLAAKILFAGLVMTAFVSCVSNKKFNALMEEKEALSKSLADSQEMISTLEDEKTSLMEEQVNLNAQITQIQSDLAATMKEVENVKTMIAQKEAQLKAVETTLTEAFAVYQKSGLTVVEKDGRLYISMSEKVLFRSGSASLDKQDKEILTTLANVMKANPSMRLYVEGHTDDQKLVQGAAYSDNWALSVARSVAVVRYLTGAGGVDSSQVVAAGRGEFDPASEDRAENRRTEFVIDPEVADLYDMMKG
ncbi:MAG: OmpA family protein [Saprospiraceae bacterium]|nr:OmpA family protein [Saprospiraceae bacterium]